MGRQSATGAGNVLRWAKKNVNCNTIPTERLFTRSLYFVFIVLILILLRVLLAVFIVVLSISRLSVIILGEFFNGIPEGVA